MRALRKIGPRAGTTIVFALNGLLFATLFARLPAIKSDLGLSEGEIGLAVLCGSVGLVASQLAAGALTVRFGSRPVVAAGVLLYSGLLVLPALAWDGLSLAIGYLVLGAGAGILDVAMNVQGVAVERRSGRRVFASFHAAFSFGALGGALLGAVSAEAGVGPLAEFTATGAVAAAVGLVAAHGMLAEREAAPDAPLLPLPSRPLAAIAAIAFCAALIEGSVSDWSAILLDEDRGAAQSVAALGLAGFSLTMAIGRLTTDPLSARWGAAAVTRGGALVALAGLAIAIGVDAAAAGVAGFLIAGAGIAALFPLSLRAAGRLEGAPAATSIAGASTAAYTAFLAGPAAIGLSADVVGLPAAMAITLPLCFVVAALAGAVGD